MEYDPILKSLCREREKLTAEAASLQATEPTGSVRREAISRVRKALEVTVHARERLLARRDS